MWRHPPIFLDGFEVVDSGDAVLGRIAIATNDYERGERVLVEPPTYLFDPQEAYLGMMKAFVGISEAAREETLDMYCPNMLPEDEEDGENNKLPHNEQQTKLRLQMLEWEYARVIPDHPDIKELLPLEKAKKLMRIIDANAHSFSLESTGALVASQWTRPKEFSALFARGSKVEHSCHPNLTFDTNDGKLQYVATRAIPKGGRISISYQTAPCEKPRRARQEFLRMNKDFTCGCHRCQGPNECNPYLVSCLVCNNFASVAFSYGADNEVRCVACQSALPSGSAQPQKDSEKSFEQRLDEVLAGLQSGAVVDEGPGALTKLIKLQNEMAATLHPLHWLHPKGYRLISSAAASFARHQMKQRRKGYAAGTTECLYLSTTALLFQARWVRQIASVLGGQCTLQEMATQNRSTPRMPESPSLQSLQAVADDLCEKDVATQTIYMAHPLFHAGQDWLLCGDAVHVAKLYKCFWPLFESWIRLSDEDREKMLLLIESEGKENRFGNHLLF